MKNGLGQPLSNSRVFLEDQPPNIVISSKVGYGSNNNNHSIDYRREENSFNDNDDFNFSGTHHLSFDISKKSVNNNKVISTKGSRRYLNIADDEDDDQIDFNINNNNYEK